MLLVLRVLLSLATTRLSTQKRKGRIKPQSLLKHPEGLTEKYKITIITLDHMTRSARSRNSIENKSENWRVLSRAGWRECLLTEKGRAGRENVRVEVMTLCSVCSVRSVRTSWTRANYYRFRPSHSVNNYVFWAESLEYSLRPSLRYASVGLKCKGRWKVLCK